MAIRGRHVIHTTRLRHTLPLRHEGTRVLSKVARLAQDRTVIGPTPQT